MVTLFGRGSGVGTGDMSYFGGGVGTADMSY